MSALPGPEAAAAKRRTTEWTGARTRRIRVGSNCGRIHTDDDNFTLLESVHNLCVFAIADANLDFYRLQRRLLAIGGLRLVDHINRAYHRGFAGWTASSVGRRKLRAHRRALFRRHVLHPLLPVAPATTAPAASAASRRRAIAAIARSAASRKLRVRRRCRRN